MAESVRTGTAREPVGVARQALRLARTEFTLLYRYRTAAYMALLPVVLIGLVLIQPDDDIAPGVEVGAYMLAGLLVLGPMMVAIMNVSNVYTARRELLILKRFRASGVPPTAMFASTTLAMLGLSLVLALVAAGILVVHFDHLPSDPVLILLAIVLTTVTMTLLGAAFTRLCRNAESAQMLVMVPFLLLLATSGFVVPLDVMPEWAQTASRLLPMAPAVEIAGSAYFGMALFGDIESAGALSGGALWGEALPNLAVMLAWLAVSVFLLRYFRWDPREAK